MSAVKQVYEAVSRSPLIFARNSETPVHGAFRPTDLSYFGG